MMILLRVFEDVLVALVAVEFQAFSLMMVACPVRTIISKFNGQTHAQNLPPTTLFTPLRTLSLEVLVAPSSSTWVGR
jgi:hypothetical protein